LVTKDAPESAKLGLGLRTVFRALDSVSISSPLNILVVCPGCRGEFGGLRVRLEPVRPGGFYCGESVCFLNFFFASLSSH